MIFSIEKIEIFFLISSYLTCFRETTKMNSNNTATAAATAATATETTPAPEYTSLQMDEWAHEWKVSRDKFNNPDDKAAISTRISDYYAAESKKTKNPAFPRHHALVLAALGSSSKFVSRGFPSTVVSGYERCSTTTTTRTRTTTTTRLTSPYQKHHLTALSGMTGLLVMRLMTPTTPQFITLKTKKKYAEITQQYIHSALAAEYLVGNRYYRILFSPLACLNEFIGKDQNHPVGFLDCDVNLSLTAESITPDAICATQDVLRQLYNDNIARLRTMVQQYKRGFVSRETICEDPEFVRLMSAYWRVARQLMKMKDDFETQAAQPLTQLWFSARKNAKRITVISKVTEPGVIAPGLYDYDIAHIFDNTCGSYARYVQSTKSTWLRLASDGSNASFLGFAAIEPTMVTEDYAPRIGGNFAEYHGLSFMSCANYIPSRDPIFGALKKQHQSHMIRTAYAVNESFGRVHPYQHNSPARGVCRDHSRFEEKYAPFYEIVEDVRTIVDISADWTYEENRKNKGKIVSAYEGIREFRERVWPSVGRGIVSEYTLGDNDDDDDDYYYDHNNDEDRCYYHHHYNPRDYDNECEDECDEDGDGDGDGDSDDCSDADYNNQ